MRRRTRRVVLTLQVPGSPSSALTTRYFGRPSSGLFMKLHFRPLGEEEGEGTGMGRGRDGMGGEEKGEGKKLEGEGGEEEVARHLGKPAPPLPRRPEALISSTIHLLPFWTISFVLYH